MWIAYAMDRLGEHHDEMWDEEDGFFYDLLRLPDGQAMRLKVRSLVGLLPLCASTVFEAAARAAPELAELIGLFRERHPELVVHIAPNDEGFIGYKDRRLLSILNKKKLERVLATCSMRTSFSAPTASVRSRAITRNIRSSSTPAVRNIVVHYLPAESNTGMFGGNSNWRGPVWMPVNALIVRAC